MKMNQSNKVDNSSPAMEKMFRNATFESNIVGDLTPFNAVKLITLSRPYINGIRVSLIKTQGVFILEYADLSEDYVYLELTAEQALMFTEIECDGNDGWYSKQLNTLADELFF